MMPVRIAQIGTAHDHARQTMGSLLRNRDCFSVFGLAASETGGSDPVYAGVPRYTVEELLDMPMLEAVAVESAERDATELARRFAARGIAVHLDKPGSPDAAAFDRLTDTVKANRVPFQMGYMYRCNPVIRQAIAMVKSGELGEIFSVEAQMSVRHDAQKRAWLEAFPGGMMFYLGCHLVDLVLQIQGEPAEILPMNTSSGLDGNRSADSAFAVFRYKNGTSFVKSCAAEYGGYARRQLVICGSRGTAELKPLETGTGDGRITTTAVFTLEKDKPDPWGSAGQRITSDPFDRYDGMMRTFARIVRGEEENPYSCDYERLLFRTLMKCCDEGSQTAVRTTAESEKGCDGKSQPG